MNTKLEPLQPHPLALLFPALAEPELKELGDDIKANGLKQSIVTFEDASDGYQGPRTLDGVNREKACVMVGVEPTYTPFQGDYAAAMKFVMTANVLRRHLEPGQRSMIAAKLANMKQGERINPKHAQVQMLWGERR